MNQSLPSFSHFTSLLLLCILPFMVRLKSAVVPYQFCLSLEVSELSFFPSYQYLCSLCIFFQGHLIFFSFFLFFNLHNLFSHFFSCTTLAPCLSGNYTPSFPRCQIPAQTGSASHLSGFRHRVRQDVSPAAQPLSPQPGDHAWMAASCFGRVSP